MVAAPTVVADAARGKASVSLSYNPTPATPLGLTARVAPSWGGQATQRIWALPVPFGRRAGERSMPRGGTSSELERCRRKAWNRANSGQMQGERGP